MTSVLTNFSTGNSIEVVLPRKNLMTQSRPTVTRISDAVVGGLEKRILEGSLKPGDRLPSERVFAVDLGVSRPSLREAIQKLISKGLLAVRHGSGTFVTDRLEAQFVDPWQEMLSGHPTLQSDLLEFRQMLESQAAQLAAERATNVDIERLDALFATLDSDYANNDVAASIEADVAFHQAIADAAHNVLIGHMTASLMRVLHGHVSINLEHLHTRPQKWDQVRAQHHAIWQAIREHQPDKAALAARSHIEFVRQSITDSTKEMERRLSGLRRQGESPDLKP
jgi:GntR family transcriptional regulator, transcriptional repressor for pyruvate dehydrogenase complex